MKVTSAALDGLAVVTSAPVTDERGVFTTLFDRDVFAAAGLPTSFAQHALSSNAIAGTLRGLHFQRAPHAEAKLVRCLRGALFDVAVDVRRASRTFGAWASTTLQEGDARAVFVPAGFAHGFQTLVDGTDVLYLLTEPYWPETAAGVRWDDPMVDIAWPQTPTLISDRDRALPFLDDLPEP